MTKRRMGTRPHSTHWTPEGIAMIEAYQAKHCIPSFSAAAETLVRMGLEKSPGEILEPIIVSTIRQTVHRELDRLVHLQIRTAIDAAAAYRFAAATARDVGRLKQDPDARYQEMKAWVIKEARQSLSHANLKVLVEEVYAALHADDAPGNGAVPEQATTLAEALELDERLSDEETASLIPFDRLPRPNA